MSNDFKEPLTTPGKGYGVDSVSGKPEEAQADTSNYPHIEEFMNGLEHDHEVEHAMYHGAKRLSSKEGDEGKNVTVDDYKKLAKDDKGYN